MTIQRVGVGPRMSNAVVHGDTVYLAGQVADSTAKDVKGQTAEVLAKIEAALSSVGSDKTKILSATIYLSNIGSFADMNSVWDGWVSQGNTPARTTVEARLAAPGYLVEITVVAAK